MKKWISMISLAVMATSVHAEEYKSFWRCRDGHLEAIEPFAVIQGKKVPTSVHFRLPKEQTFRSQNMGLKSMVTLPAGLKQGDFLLLGAEQKGLMNCVGEVVINPNYHQSKLVFDVTRNAFGCPLIPVDCAVQLSTSEEDN